MNNKCGLINKSNPCRCDKKTKAFIQAGWVDKENLKFNTSYLKRISEVAPDKSNDLNDLTEIKYVYSGDIDPLFREADPTRQICLAGRTME
jgi:hypothetical protein